MTLKNINHQKCHIFEKDRLASFKSWPFGSTAKCSIEKMAEAGFFWCGNERENDTTACFICDKTLDGWEQDDDPWTEHQKHAPQCAFIKLGRPEKDLTLGEFLELVDKVLENLLQKQRTKLKKKVSLFCERKREELIKSFKP